MGFGNRRVEGLERVEAAVVRLTEQVTDLGGALQGDVTETRARADALAHTHSDLARHVDDVRRVCEANSRDIAAARRELAELHALIESRRADDAEALAAPPAPHRPEPEPEPQLAPEPEPEPQPGLQPQFPPPPPPGFRPGLEPFDHDPHGDDHDDPHDELLAQAAGVANAELVCHRDTWSFLAGQAGGGEHFRMPVDVFPSEDPYGEGGSPEHGTIRIPLSGRSLLGLADALWDVTRSPGTTPGTRHLAAQTYNRIQAALTHTHSGPAGSGRIVRIVVDDRVPGDGHGSGGPRGRPADDEGDPRDGHGVGGGNGDRPGNGDPPEGDSTPAPGGDGTAPEGGGPAPDGDGTGPGPRLRDTP